jgi:hypothetical protein
MHSAGVRAYRSSGEVTSCLDLFIFFCGDIYVMLREQLSILMEENKGMGSPGAYKLLKEYRMQARVLASAFHFSECYHREVHRWLTYPLILLTVSTTVLSAFELNKYVVCALSFASLLLTSFNSAVRPKDREYAAHAVSGEFQEIADDIHQYITENHKTADEIKAYSNHVNSVLSIWKGQSPACRDSFISRAQLKHSPRMRSSKKKRESESPPVFSRDA